MLPKRYCTNCKSRSTCTAPCKEVEQDLQNFTSPGKETPHEDLSMYNKSIEWNPNTYGDKLIKLLERGLITDNQHRIMWMRLVDGLTQSEIAHQLCITQQTVSKVLQSLQNVKNYV